MTKLDYPPKTKEELEEREKKIEQQIAQQKEGQWAILEAMIDAGASPEKVIAAKKAMGLDVENNDTKEGTPEDNTPKDTADANEPNNEPGSKDGSLEKIEAKEAKKMLAKIKLDTKRVQANINELISQGFTEVDAKKIADIKEVMLGAQQRIDILTRAEGLKDQEKLLKSAENNLAEQQTALSKLISERENLLKKEEEEFNELKNIVAQMQASGKSEEEIAELFKSKNVPEEIINKILGKETTEENKPEGTGTDNSTPEIKVSTDVNPEARKILNGMGYKNSDIDKISREEREKILKGGIPAEDYYKNKGAAEQGNEPDKNQPPSPEPTVDNINENENKIIEKQKELDEAREAYLEEYRRCEKEAHRQNLIEKTKNSILNIFHKKENKIKTRIEDFFTDKMKELEVKYKDAKISLGNIMYLTKRDELEKNNKSTKEIEDELAKYKSTEILNKVVVEERQKIIKVNQENKEKVSLLKKMLDGYRKMPRWQRVAISTALFTAAASTGIVSGGIIAGYGLAGMATIKFAKSMAIGSAVGYLGESVDWMNRKKDKEFAIRQNIQKNNVTEQYGKGEMSLEDYEKSIDSIARAEKIRYRNRTLFKAGLGVAVAGFSGYLAYDMLGNGISHIENITHGSSGHIDAISGPDAGHVQNIVDHTKVPGGVVKNIIEHNDIKAVADHGQGAISTLRELQNNLRIEYGNNLDNAPVSVKHILNTDAHKLAEEYGMYKPGQDAESAFVKSGSYFEVDKSGNLTYHALGEKGGGLVLEKGTDIKVSNLYTDKMSDTDHSGLHHNIGEHNHTNDLMSDQQTAPEVIDLNQGGSAPEVIDLDQRQVAPEVIDLNNGGTAPEVIDLDKTSLIDNNIPGNHVVNGVLNASQIEHAHHVFDNNIDHLFNERPHTDWEYIQKNIPAERIIEMSKNGGVRDDLIPLVDHMEKLKNLTGIRPYTQDILHPDGPETIPHYIGRALEEAEKMGVIDKVTL